MNLLAYIQGNRKGKEAHRIEKEAMRDPFLADALEGFDTVKANHAERISRLRNRISPSTHNSGQKKIYIGIAASLLFCLTIGGYFLLNQKPDNLIAMSDLNAKKAAEEYFIEEEEISLAEVEIPEPPDGINVQSENRLQAVAAAPSSPPVAAAEIISESIVVEYADIQEIIDEQHVAQQEIYVAARKAEAEVLEDNAAALKEKVMEERMSMAASRARSLNLETAKISIPEPEIGMEAYEKYLKESKLPLKDEACSKIKGIVEVEFHLKEGKPTNFVVQQSLCDAADKEAIRLIENGSKWIGEDGQKVVLKVSF